MTAAVSLVLFLGFTGCAGRAHADDATGEAGFTPLFNGKDLAGWFYGSRGGKVSKAGEGYRIDADRGVLYCTEKDGGTLLTEKEYANFILRLEFKLTPGANNGIALRAPRAGNIAYDGIELQILDDTAEKYAKLRPEQYHGSIYDTVAAQRGHLKPVGEWNEQEVIVDGRRIKVILNGATIVDANLADVKDEAKLKKHPGLTRTTGHLGFLGHGTALEFRNVRIKELP
ncbi:MAG: DUF1080 domain-containing protein [Tepidisphaeraceae bacterium]